MTKGTKGAAKVARRAKLASYTVRFEHDEDGWHVFVPSVAGVRTHARTIAQGLERIREALSLAVDDADSAELVPSVQLSASVDKAVARAVAAREALAKAEAEAAEATRAAAVAITSKHVGMRDAAAMLGVSHQRVAQWVADSTR